VWKEIGARTLQTHSAIEVPQKNYQLPLSLVSRAGIKTFKGMRSSLKIVDGKFSGRIEVCSRGEAVGGMEKVKICRVVEFREPFI